VFVAGSTSDARSGAEPGGESSVGAAPRLEKLTREQCRTIHEASLRLLETVGIEAGHPQAREILAGAGAVVEGTRVRVSRSLVEWALGVTPNSFTLHSRDGEPVMEVGGDNVYFGVGPGTLAILDHRSGERRPSTLADTAEGSRVVDALPNIDYLMSLFTPLDIDQRLAYVHEFKAMLRNCTKPCIFLSHAAEDMRSMVAMLEVVAGGAEELRHKPRGLGYANITHPFRHEYEDLERLIFLAEKGIPLTYVPLTMAGVSGPITRAGATAAANAGELFGLVVAQLVNEGCPVALAGGASAKLDMRSMVTIFSAPENRVASTQMARFYDIPNFGLAGASDSKLVDEQAAAEAALTMLVEALAGSNLIHDVGYMESGGSNSLAQIVIGDEIIGWIRRFLDPIVVDEETLALELIERVAPMGDYLAEDHTLAHYEDDWYPGLFDHSSHDTWASAGSLSLGEKAARRVDELLASHEVPDLPAPVLARLDAIIASRATQAA